MAGSDKTVKVTLVAVSSPYAKGMSEASVATKKLGSDIDAVGGKSKGFASSAGQATAALKGMAVAGAAVAGTALVSFLSDSVQAAGDLEQSVGGVDAVFKDSAKTIHDFGQNAAENIGLSQNSFNELITVTGALLKNKGLEDFTQKSLDLVKIGADLSATYGGTTKDAVEALNAAMRGESDPIERYGISLSETAVNAELAAKGLQGLTGQALEQAKAQARIDIITRQSADALGKFANEADTLQGQQQRLNAQWEDAKASLGQALLPALTQVTSALRVGVDAVVAAVHAWGDLPGPVKAAVGALVAFRIAQGPLGTVSSKTAGTLKALREALSYASQSADRAGGGFKGLSAGFKTFTGSAGLAKGAMNGLKGAGSALMGLAGGPWGLAIAGLTAAIGGYIQAQQNARQAAEDFAETLDKQTGAFTEQSRTLAVQKFFKDFSQQDYSKVSGSLEHAGVAVSDLIAAYEKGGPAVTEFKSKFDAWQAAAMQSGDADIAAGAQDIGNAYAALGRDMDGAREIASVTADTQNKVATATKEAGSAASSASPDVDKYAALVKKIGDASETAKGYTHDLAQAMLDVKQAAGDADAANIAYQQSLDDAQARIEKRIELEKQLKNAGGVSERTQNLQSDLSKESDPKKRAKLQEELTKSRAKDAKSATEEQAKLREELDKYTATLDTNTQAGRDNLSALLELKNNALQTAEANLKNGDSVDSVKAKVAQAREDFIKLAMGFGDSRKEAELLADRYDITAGHVDNLKSSMDKIPRDVVSTIQVQKDEAEKKLKELRTIMTGEWLGDKTIRISTIYQELGSQAARTQSQALRHPELWRADGGPVWGPGTSTSDSIAARLSNGEYVIKADAVKKYGQNFFDSVNAMRFADGGLVSRMPAMSSSGSGIDYDALGAAVARYSRPVMSVQSGLDATNAARAALRDYDWRAANG